MRFRSVLTDKVWENAIQWLDERVSTLAYVYTIPDGFLCRRTRYSVNSKGTELKQLVHTHRTSCRAGWPRGFGELNLSPHSKYFLPLMAPTSVSEWIPVVAPIYSLPLGSEYLFTLHQSVALNLSDMWQWWIQGAQPPLIFRPNWGPSGRKKFLLRLAPPPPLSQSLVTGPPLSEGLDPPLCGAPLSKSTRRRFASLKKLRRNHRGVVFVPAQKLSDMVCAHEISIVNNYLMVSARAAVDLSTKVVT